ncbi:hypothetical protein SLE2022_326940 [Rubroshorea leprosula]
MATPGQVLAEAYVLRKVYKEKLRKMEEEAKENRAKVEEIDFEAEKPGHGGCFLSMFKKIHPVRPLTMQNDAKEEDTSDHFKG